MSNRTSPRSSHDQIIKLTIWVSDRKEEFSHRPPTVKRIIADYKRDSGVEVSTKAVSRVFDSLELRLGRPQRQYRLSPATKRRTDRMERLIREVYELSKQVEALSEAIGAGDEIDCSTSDGLNALYRHQHDPSQGTNGREQSSFLPLKEGG